MPYICSPSILEPYESVIFVAVHLPVTSISLSGALLSVLSSLTVSSEETSGSDETTLDTSSREETSLETVFEDVVLDAVVFEVVFLDEVVFEEAAFFELSFESSEASDFDLS